MSSLGSLLAEMEEAHRRHGRRLIGLRPEQIGDLESAIQQRLPDCLRETVACVGLLTNPIRGMHSRLRDWILHSEILREAETRLNASVPLVSFAMDLAENDLALRSDDSTGDRIWLVDHEETNLKELGVSFASWLAARWEEARPDLATPRRWALQFCFRGDPDHLVRKLALAMGGTLTGGWEDRGISGARVTRWTGALRIGNEVFELGRLEHAAWPLPLLFLSASDPEAQLESGWIERFRAAFERANIATEEVDYGLLPDDRPRADDVPQ